MAAARRAGLKRSVPADHIGRPVFATNAAGVKVWSAVYTPFGGVYTSSGALPNARFPGQWYQAESGLHQNWMRDYDPTTGRYVEADPLGLVDGASVYGYVTQNPGRWVDPRGEQAGAIAEELLWGGIRIGGQLLGGAAIVLGIILSPTQLGDGTMPQSVANEIDEECNNRDCEKARPYQLKQAEISDPHTFKTEYGAVPNSRFDICACKDGSIVIRAQGQCGQSGPTTATYERWK